MFAFKQHDFVALCERAFPGLLSKLAKALDLDVADETDSGIIMTLCFVMVPVYFRSQKASFFQKTVALFLR